MGPSGGGGPLHFGRDQIVESWQVAVDVPAILHLHHRRQTDLGAGFIGAAIGNHSKAGFFALGELAGTGTGAPQRRGNQPDRRREEEQQREESWQQAVTSFTDTDEKNVASIVGFVRRRNGKFKRQLEQPLGMPIIAPPECARSH